MDEVNEMKQELEKIIDNIPEEKTHVFSAYEASDGKVSILYVFRFAVLIDLSCDFIKKNVLHDQKLFKYIQRGGGKGTMINRMKIILNAVGEDLKKKITLIRTRIGLPA